MNTPYAFIEPSGKDDAPAINKALRQHGSVMLGVGSYEIGSLIDMPPNTALRGQSKFATYLNKSYNGYMIRLGSCAIVSHMQLAGGPPYTGGAFLITGEAANNSFQTLEHVGAYSEYAPLVVTDSCAGNSMYVHNCNFSCSPFEPWRYAVLLPEYDTVSGGNRRFRTVNFGGNLGIYLNGAGNTYLDDVSCSGLGYTPNTRVARVYNSRIGGGYPNWTPGMPTKISMQGMNHNWGPNNATSAQIVLEPGCYHCVIEDYSTQVIDNSGLSGTHVIRAVITK